ncbi:carbon-nitrogen hydrolase family protein [Deinococcus sp.]|uniref:carbon-nitrogen hydrolase family protein n=1 Tax=Deinococcus sp. TaxID=47478 RepID=UPI0025EC7B41|nr:carbon-nitrogen hydrolase family protein [Deinococcus sp.]
MTVLHLAAAAYPCQRYAHWDEFEAFLSAFVAEGVSGGAQVLLLPEYASLELLSLLPEALHHDVLGQRHALQMLLPGFLDVHARLARQHGVYLLGGSFIVEVSAGRYLNRAHLHGPDGELGLQDKLIMTRFENEEWSISPGEGLSVFETAYGKLGVNICYDAEFADLARAQARAGMELLLVPSFTGNLHGYHRVRVGAMARALENQIYVAQSPCLADAPWSYAIETAVGAAGVYAPADPGREGGGNGLPETGVVAQGEVNVPGWLHTTLDLDVTREVRRNGHVLNARDQAKALAQAQGEIQVNRMEAVRP